MRFAETLRKHPTTVATLAGLAMVWELVRYLLVTETRSQMADDAFVTWQPLAESVLSGTPLYTAGAVDNKPPLWLFQQLLAEASPHYLATNLLLVGFANAGIAICIWYLFVRSGRRDQAVGVGRLGAALFLLGVPVVAAAISNKNAAVLFVLVAMTQRDPLRAGGAMAVAGLFAQQVVLAIPAVAWFAYRQGERTGPSPLWWLARYAASGLAVVLAVYGVVAVAWGPDSAVRGMQLVTGLVGPDSGSNTYFLGGFGSEHALFVAPWRWLYTMYVTLQGVYFLVVPALLGGYVALRGYTRGTEPAVAAGFLLVGASLALALAIRAFRNYWVLILPSLAVLAAVGYVTIASRGTDALAGWGRTATE